MKVKLDIISTFISVLEEAYQNMKVAELNQENLNMTKEMISRCLEDETLSFYSDIFNSETKEVETSSDDNADDFTDIKDVQDSLSHNTTDNVAEPLADDDDKYNYRYIDNRRANRRVISDKTFNAIDDAIVNTETSKEALEVLRKKGIDVSYSINKQWGGVIMIFIPVCYASDDDDWGDFLDTCASELSDRA